MIIKFICKNKHVKIATELGKFWKKKKRAVRETDLSDISALDI